MTREELFSAHCTAALYALICGVLLGILWLLLRPGRRYTEGALPRFAADCLFVLSFAACYFQVSRQTFDGRFRLVPLVVQTAGLLLFLKGPGRWVDKALGVFFQGMRRLFSFLFCPIVFILQKTAGVFKKIFAFFKKILKKVFIFLKKYIIIYKSKVTDHMGKQKRRTANESAKNTQSEISRYYH